jgi:hypothetical protein
MKVNYLHSEVLTFERVEILRDLRMGQYGRHRRHQPAARGAGPARGQHGGDLRRSDKEGFLRQAPPR